MSLDKQHLKYPLYLFIAILVAKFGYIIVESFYNYYVLVTTTSAELSKETIEALNINGHRISSIGITLLLVPFFYLAVKKYSDKIIYSSLAIATIITYTITYNLLNSAIDSIVASNKDKRHDAYYVNIFKYGILNNIFAYNSFIDSKKIADDKIDVNDRILLTNSFLLLHADEKLISKLKQRGKEAVADIYISKNKKEDYAKNFKAFEEATKQIKVSWKDFNDARKKLYKELKKYEDEAIIKKAHKELISSVKAKYNDYIQAWNDVDDTIARETSQDKLEEIAEPLKKYFYYKGRDRAEREYKERMDEEFGYYIEPQRWRNSSDELTYKSIKKLITEEILKKASRKSSGVPRGLKAKAFFNNLDVKIQVANKLKEKGILIPFEFDYSYKQFKKYFTIAMTHENNQAPKTFYKKLKEKIGTNDLKLDMDWNAFIDSNYIKSQIKTKLNTTNDEDINNIIKAIQSKDLGNFKLLVYLPKVVEEVENMMYKESDFNDGGKAASVGDEAIKLLYIPPFALAVSILALLLNMVTLLGMGLQYTNKLPNVAINIVKGVFVVIILITPIMSDYDGFDNELIRKASSDEISTYLSFLNWISYYETINSSWHK